MRALAHELAPFSIRVNAVAPTAVGTGPGQAPGPDPSGSPVTAGFAPCDGPVVNLVRAVEDPHGARRRVQFGQYEVL